MLKIILAAPEHAEGIYVIERQSFAEPWSISSIAHEITYKHSVCLVAINENEKIIGHVSMRHIINEGHINNIAVLAEERKRGVGSLLLKALIGEAVKREIIGLTLEVRVSNNAAIKLYEKYGFTIEGYRKNYYSSPSEDAAIMWKKLSPQKCGYEVQE
jgi:ribosomal-protein-alanine N-acetyltransferase